MKSRPLTTGEVARYCHVTTNGVKKWIAEGKLKAFQLPGGHYRISKRDFREFLEYYKIPIEEEFFIESRKILIVDDEPTIVELIKATLEKETEDYLIETAVDGYDALVKVGDFKPDLLILDMKMPRVDGYEVCKRILENPQTNHIRILAMTGQAEEEAIERMKNSGATAYILKPLDLTKLKQMVADLFD